MNIALSWSSGKDAALAYYILKNQDYKIANLVTTVSEEYNRVVMHGTREELLETQANRIGVPLTKIKIASSTSHDQYEIAIKKTYTDLIKKGINKFAYGDIFLKELREYREDQLREIGGEALFPLWNKNTKDIISLVETAGIKAMIVCTNDFYLGKEFLGQDLSLELINSFPKNVDPCGENGEFHTFVYDAPFFSNPISIAKKEVVYKKYQSSDNLSTAEIGYNFLEVIQIT